MTAQYSHQHRRGGGEDRQDRQRASDRHESGAADVARPGKRAGAGSVEPRRENQCREGGEGEIAK